MNMIYQIYPRNLQHVDINFFKEMYSCKNQNSSFHNEIVSKLKDKLKQLDNNKDEHILNNAISKEEILKAVKTLKKW